VSQSGASPRAQRRSASLSARSSRRRWPDGGPAR
jgi:hypothetical protein